MFLLKNITEFKELDSVKTTFIPSIPVGLIEYAIKANRIQEERFG